MYSLINQKFHNKISKFLINHKYDVIFLIGIFIYCLKFLCFMENTVDIKAFDETIYLYQGVIINKKGLPSSQFAPFYSIRYYVLSLFEPNRVDLYYLNQKILIILTGLLLYIFLRILKNKNWLCFIISYFYVNSHIIMIWPFVNLFTLLIILFCSIIATYFFINKQIYYYIITIAFLYASWTRPEFFIAFISLLILSIINFYRLNKNKKIWYELIVFISIIVLSVYIFRNPLSGGRSFFAFSQHFALNWVDWNKSDLDPWFDYNIIVKETFGNSKNIIQAFYANPLYFFKHILSNIIQINKTVIDLLTPIHSDFLPTIFTSYYKIFINIVILFLLIVLVYKFKQFLAQIRVLIKNQYFRRTLIIFLGILFAVLPSIIIIYPREHYLIIPLVFVLVLVTCYFNYLLLELSINIPKIKFFPSIIIMLLLLFVTPNISSAYNFIPKINKQYESDTPNLTTIRFIKKLPIKFPVTILDGASIYPYYGDNYRGIIFFEKPSDDKFFEFLDAKNINIILITPELFSQRLYINDKDFLSIIHYPTNYGFVRINIPNTSRFLLIKKDLIGSQ